MLVISGGVGTALLDAWVTWAWHGPRPPVRQARPLHPRPPGGHRRHVTRDCPAPPGRKHDYLSCDSRFWWSKDTEHWIEATSPLITHPQLVRPRPAHPDRQTARR